jgi:hypothetical protein
MGKKSMNRREDPLVRLVSAAGSDVLGGLIMELARREPEVRRKYFEYLKKLEDWQAQRMASMFGIKSRKLKSLSCPLFLLSPSE